MEEIFINEISIIIGDPIFMSALFSLYHQNVKSHFL
jgi:hypothetical protein